jgi:hypothetical protein
MMRVNLLRAHGSPKRYLYHKGCRCAACRGQASADSAAYYAAHRDERLAYGAAHDAAHRDEKAFYRAAYNAEHRDEKAAYSAAYRATHREETTAHRRERKYGLLPGEWDAMFAAQDNSCAVCGADDPGSRQGWHTDHDHGTGVVRGILCQGCNTGLGLFRDDPARLVAAIEYLEAKP